MKTGNRTIKEYDRRISLRCPAVISSSLLQQSNEDGRYSIKLTLENTGNSEVDNDAIESATFVIRCLDSNGDNVFFDDNEYLVKTVNFGESGLPNGEDVSMMVMLGAFDDIDIVDFEIYVNKIRFADGSVFDYLRADFFMMPTKPIPLTKRLNRSETEQAKKVFGESAEFIPQKLSAVVWRCTCGEISEDAVCQSCGASRDDLFDYFRSEGAPLAVGERDSEEENGFFAGILSFFKKADKAKIAIVGILSLTVLLLSIVLIFTLAGKSKDGGKNTGKISKDQETNITTTAPITENNQTKLARAYAASHAYDHAIEAAQDPSVPTEVLYEILLEAVNYYKDAGEYTKAYEYSLMLPTYDDSNVLLSLAYDKYIENGSYEQALDIASQLNDREKLLSALAKQAELLVSSGRYLEAYNTAMSYSDSELALNVAQRGVEELSEIRDYDGAMELALLIKSEDLTEKINKEAASYYISSGDYDRAAKYAAASGDPDTLRSLCANLSDGMVKENLPSYFEYLTAERKRNVLASKISAGRTAAIIAPNGRVLYGMGEIYTPPAGVQAVSVASGEDHTVILLSNGRVVAFGDNTYGQCNVSSYKDVVMISAGKYHTIVLMADGTVAAAGDNTYGQCNVAALTGVTMISAGYEHTLFLFADGTVRACGKNTNSQCDVSSFKNVVLISAGKLHSVAITSDKKALSCGSVLMGMRSVSSWSNLRSISAGGSFTVGMTADSDLLITGSTISGSVGSAAEIAGAQEICAGEAYILAYMPDNTIVATGSLSPDVSWINSYIASS